MKQNKKVFVICTIVILALVGSGVFLFLGRKNNVDLRQNDKMHTIVSKERINDYDFYGIASNNYYIGRHNKVGIANKKGELLTEISFVNPSYPSNHNYGKYSVLYNSENKKYEVYNEEGKLLVSNSDQIMLCYDEVNNKYYYFVDRDGLYDFDNNVILKDPDVTYVSGEYVYSYYGNIYNMKTKKTIKGEFHREFGDYTATKEGQKLHLYIEKDHSFISASILESSDDGYLLNIDNKQYMLSFSGRLTEVEKVHVLDYDFDYSACKIGFKVYQDTQISDQCFYDYEEFENSIILHATEGNYILKDKEIKKIEANYTIQGSYLVENLIDNTVIYDENLIEVENSCSQNFTYVDNDKYICNDSNHVYLVDKNLKKLSDEYDDITCNKNGYCSTNVNGSFGLMYNGIELIKPSKVKVVIFDNTIILQDAFGFDVLTLDEDASTILPVSELETDNSKLYENIDIDKIINDYNLEEMTELINQNKDLFKKYAYLTLKNQSLDKYQEQALRAFRVVAQNQEHVKEEYFLESLANLSVEYGTNLSGGSAAGTYLDTKKTITLDDKSDRVFYHEFIHFIDFSISPIINRSIYKYKDAYLNYEEYKQLSFKEKNEVQVVETNLTRFLVEGGAEVNAGIYLFNKGMTTYDIPVRVYNALSYIFGFDTMNDIFFSQESDYKLFMLLKENGLSEEEIQYFGSSIDPHYYDEDNFFNIVDTLITLYETKTNKNWLEDKEFKVVISHLIAFRNIDKKSARYQELIQLDYDFRKFYEEKLGIGTTSLFITPGFYVKDSEGTYFSFIVYEEDGTKSYLTIEYDFSSDKVVGQNKIPA